MARQLLASLAGGLIVSCQASPGEPLYGPDSMTKMAQAALLGGAVGIRANGVADVRAIVQAVNVPVIGIWKVDAAPDEASITTRMEHVRQLEEAGAAIVAIDGTSRRRPESRTAAEFIASIKRECRMALMADVSTLEEGIAAAEAGVDVVGTTLSGYTSYTRALDGPDLALIQALVRAIPTPVIAEGRIWTPDDAIAAFDAGAFAVTVGTAITRPHHVTRRFADSISRWKQQRHG